MTTSLKLNTTLGAAAIALCAAYIGLVVATIFFAALQTKLADTMQSTQTEIAALESSYYDSVAMLDATDPRTLGFVKPSRVEFVAAAAAPSLSLASR